MTTYNAVWQIIKRNYGSLLVGIISMGVITFFYARQITTNTTELNGVNIAIINEDSSDISKSLEKEVLNHNNGVTLKNTAEKTKDDALYFGEVDYILTIPKGFGSKLASGESPSVESETKPGSYSSVFADSSINTYINTYKFYQTQFPSQSEQELLTMTEKNLAKEGKVHFDQSYQKVRRQSLKAAIYNLLAFGLFTTIFSGYAAINLVFNKKEIKDRNSCSPVSHRALSRKISCATFIYAFVCFVLFSLFVFFSTGVDFDLADFYLFLNSVVFFSVMVSFSILMTSLIKNSETISGVNYVFIMGTCFISGVFVPSSVLPSIVNNIASFTPTYWFVQNNNLIGSTVDFKGFILGEFGTHLLIMIGFTLVFLVIHFITMKESQSTQLFNSQRKTINS